MSVEIPAYQPFYLETVAALREEIARLGLALPVEEDSSALAQDLEVAGKRIPNRFCAQPIAGHDAEADGAPGPLMQRRYRRLAHGFGLVWMEAVGSERGGLHPRVGGAPGPAGAKVPRLHAGTLAAYRGLVEELHAGGAVVIVQLAGEDLLQDALLAAEAGFDGVDLQGPRAGLPGVLTALRARAPGLLLATRLCAFAAVRGGFGVAACDYRQLDLTEPIRLVQQLRECGLQLLNVTSASPALRGPQRAERARGDAEPPDEHPLMTLQRQLTLAQALRAAAPGLPVVASGFSWLQQFVPHVAAGALRAEMLDFAGLGRYALADPGLPARTLAGHPFFAETSCIVCHACTRLHAEGEPVGCVLRDGAVYGPIYRGMRRFDGDTLLAGAARCHLCETAPCVSASPAGTDIPGFIQAFREGDARRAYEIIRARDVLPELTARVAPAWLESEGACIERTLTGTPVPIGDLQYTIAWQARERGDTGVRLPETSTGHRVAILGGGPAGVAAAARLLERGHTVHLYEKEAGLGGAPALYLAARELPGPQAEIDALLQPALAAGRLHLHLGMAPAPDDLRAQYAEVLLATGLQDGQPLGTARGVVGALAFLQAPAALPARVALLAGGDAAMDAARVALRQGARELFIIYAGPRSALHWHGNDGWWSTPGVHALMDCAPLGYETDAGAVCGVRLRHAELGESVLRVDFVIEAGILASRAAEPAEPVFAAGARENGGRSVGHCVAEALAVAEAIHEELSR